MEDVGSVTSGARGAQGRQAFTVAQALAVGTEVLSRAGIESARLDAEVLLTLALGCNRARLYIDSGQLLDPAALSRFQALLDRRAHREPCAYIVGRREFWSLDFLITPAVLVPRPETERLVEVVLKQIEAMEKPRGGTAQCGDLRLLELGTGSGAVAVSLAKERKDVDIWATDVSIAALKVARANAARHHVDKKIHFLCGDAFGPLAKRRCFFHGLIFNPPYLGLEEFDGLSPEVLREPRVALDGGIDGLDWYRTVLAEGHFYLRENGFLALEMGTDMSGTLARWFIGTGRYVDVSVHQDYAGRDRVLLARKSAACASSLGKG